MAIFKAGEENDLDYVAVRDGGVLLYRKLNYIEEDIQWLRERNYRIYEFDCAAWTSEMALHENLRSALSFPDYYGNNLNALDECMSDDLVVPDPGGLVLVLNHYDRIFKPASGLASEGRGTAEVVLSIFADAVRYHMLFGRRLLILVQSDDPKIDFGRLRGVAARWNRREWLNSSRGL